MSRLQAGSLGNSSDATTKSTRSLEAANDRGAAEDSVITCDVAGGGNSADHRESAHERFKLGFQPALGVRIQNLSMAGLEGQAPCQSDHIRRQ